MRSSVRSAVSLIFTILGVAAPAHGTDQTAPGAGNATAVELAAKSPMVRSARTLVSSRAASIRNPLIRAATMDAIGNPRACVLHRAGLREIDKALIVSKLRSERLVDPADEVRFPGGLRAGVFPPLLDEGTDCPKLPQPFFSAPGSSWGGRHSFPGGLAVHEAFNDESNVALAGGYRRFYGHVNAAGLPEIGSTTWARTDASFFIDEAIVVGAPLWHDWAKAIVFQWNADGTEFAELEFGGDGRTDYAGLTGNSKTGAHHIIGIAEAMKRNLPATFVIAQASAHASPTSGDEYKVVNWIRAAAILAGIDPVARGYLRGETSDRLRLAFVRKLDNELDIDSNFRSGPAPTLLVEYTLHHLSDADAVFTVPATAEVQVILIRLAPMFGYDPTRYAEYNNKYRNPALSFLTAERLSIVYANGGLVAVEAELKRLRRRGVL